MKCAMISVFLLLIAVCAAVHEGELSTLYRFSSALSGDDYILHWNIDQEQEVVEFAVNVSTTGWVGLGLSPNGQMPASDVVIGWVDSNGQVTFQDRYAVGRFRPPIDESQDWTLKSGEEINGRTILEFDRPFLSCDVDNDLDILPGTSRIVWAYHSRDPASEEELEMLRHERMGSTSLNLMGGLNEERVEENSASFTILQDNVEIPNVDTTYWCSVHALPTEVESEQRFIYRISPIIPEDTAPFVHHAVAYLCSSLNNSHVGTSEACLGTDITVVNECRVSGVLFAAWAVGGTDFVFPNGVAYPIGGRELYIILETHYDNQQLLEGMHDSSGLEFFYVSEEPEERAGLLSIGHTSIPSLIIPPGASNYQINGYCHNSCTQTFFPRDGINFFGNMLHTHLAGRGLVVRHFRQTAECDGVEELPPIDENRNYDFNYQQITSFPRAIQVLPGDTLLLQCNYSTSGDSYRSVTLGGESTFDEMCLAFLYYYPAMDLTYCYTVGPQTIPQEFASRYLSVSDRDTLNAGLLSQNPEMVRSVLDRVEWNQEAISSLQESVNSAIDLSLCLPSERINDTLFVPYVLTGPDCPYVPPEKVCEQPTAAAVSVHHITHALFLWVAVLLLHY